MAQDMTQAAAQDGRWMTYGELARARSIDRQSAVKLVRRQHWRRQPGNDGEVRIFVPSEGLSRVTAKDETRDEARPIAPDMTAFETALAAIEAAHASEVAVLRERADAAEMSRVAAQAMADRALVHLAEAEMRAEADRAHADQAIAGERARADALRDRVETLQVQLAQLEAEGAASDIQAAELTAQLKQARSEAQEAAAAEAARKGRGRWARLRAAWRGE
jgi:hypothetical protein